MQQHCKHAEMTIQLSKSYGGYLGDQNRGLDEYSLHLTEEERLF